MMRFFKNLGVVPVIVLVVWGSGCTPYQSLDKIVYFNQKGDSSLAATITKAEPTIQQGDRLSITVNAINQESVTPYNLSSAVTPGAMVGYLVESDGSIYFPQLGKRQVIGLTRKQVTDMLTNDLTKYVNDPIVTVQFLNAKITVLGEVARPGTVLVPEGKMTIIEALGQVGDLTSFANRTNILVIREVNGKREFGHVNILSNSVFASPYYNLAQNDVIYVEPTKLKVQNDQTFVRNLSIATTVISVLTTLVFVIINISK